MLTQEQFLEMSKSLKKAEEDDTPIIALVNDELNVVGDANKTQLNKHTYTLRFRFPQSYEQFRTPDSYDVGSWFVNELIFEDVYVSPRRDLQVVSAIMEIVPYFKSVSESGELQDKTEKELIDFAKNIPHNIIDDMYDVVSAFLGVDDSLVDFMSPMSVIDTMGKLIEDYPEVFNEADVFFG